MSNPMFDSEEMIEAVRVRVERTCEKTPVPSYIKTIRCGPKVTIIDTRTKRCVNMALCDLPGARKVLNGLFL